MDDLVLCLVTCKIDCWPNHGHELMVRMNCGADACESSQECSATGSAVGTCVFPTPSGQSCSTDSQGVHMAQHMAQQA